MLPLLGAPATDTAVVAPHEDASQEASPDAPAEPGSNLEVYLLTMGPGGAIWERFGHNAIWIRDIETGIEAAYNWGIFSFQQENFIARLARGRMLYAMYGLDVSRMIASYEVDDRSVDVHPINLTPAERLELQTTLRAMDTDTNRNYRYDYYRDNCSTRVRDALDAVLGGQIDARWSVVETETTYRWHTRRLLRSVPWAYFGIQFVVGHPGDVPISAADEMFLPLRLAAYLERTEITRADGSTTPLLGPRRVIHASSRAPEPVDARSALLAFLAVGLATAAVLGALAHSGARGSKLANGLFAVLGGSWMVATGLLGSGLVLSWFFTDHVFWRWNENALSMNPLALVAAAALFLGVVGRGRAVAQRWTFVVAGGALFGLVAQIIPAVDQVNAEIIALVLPAHLAVAWGAIRLRRVGTGATQD